MQSFDSYGDASKSGFWGVLAQKAKEILEDDHDHDTQKLRSYSFNIPPGARTQVNYILIVYLYVSNSNSMHVVLIN
jgi:hypothetical protein